MDFFPVSLEQLASTTQFSEKDLKEIKQCRHCYTQLGFGYQLAFVRTFNRFPAQEPLYIVDEIITFVSGVNRELVNYPTLSHIQVTRNHAGP